MNAAGSALIYSSYVGGSYMDEGYAIAVDSSGNAYVTGETSSENFPVKNAYQDKYNNYSEAFITKLGPTGAVLYSSYLGGGLADSAYAIAIDSSRNIYVAGKTLSLDFPTRNPYQAARKGGEDAFLTKLNAAGSALLYSTYLGSNSDGVNDNEIAYGLAVDSTGNAYVTGSTRSTKFPTTVNAYRRQLGSLYNEDAFVTKFLTTASGASSLVYSSYLGGKYIDDGRAIAADASGVAYVVGETTSDDFPTKNALKSLYDGSKDAFVTKLNTKPAACTPSPTDNCKESLLYSTYLGGTSIDGGRAIRIDSWATRT